ncbi:MAG: hypothetical protein AAF629_18065 [Chloroflexota bacterium]
MRSQMNRILYQCSRHLLFGRSLTQWLIIGLISSPFLCLLIFLQDTTGRWFIFGPLLLLSVVLLYGMWRVRKGGYLTFEEEPFDEKIAPERLKFPNKLSLSVSGPLKVNKSTRYFVEADAEFQTFQTRERAIMMKTDPTRFLLLAKSQETGWWYFFFFPNMVQSLRVGKLSFGTQSRPAIRLNIIPNEEEAEETLYLSFDTDEERARLLSDLFVDELDQKLIS